MAVKHVFRWDLDKTYLRTDFDSLRGLLRAAFEAAKDKRAVPGAPALLRALKRAGGAAHRICIISGSPRQMRTVLEAKLALDGVEWDEFVLKPNLSNFLRGRFRAIKAQLPYKLPALLESHLLYSGVAGETLFGDDAESDAVIYSLYGDCLAGTCDRDTLVRILEASEAYDDQREATLRRFDRLERRARVGRILILLDRRSPTASFDRFGSRLVPVYNYFQAALVLYADGQLGADDVLGVSREMLASGDYTLSSLANSLQDLLRRRRIGRDAATRLALESQALTIELPADLPPREEIAWAFATRVRALGELEPETASPEPVDYLRIIRRS
jgi:hypothetical protein